MNQTCVMAEELLFDPFNLGGLMFHFASSVIAICVNLHTYYKYRNNFPYHWRRQHLLYYSLLIALVLAIVSALNFGILILKIVFMSDPCEIPMLVGDCRGMRFLYLLSMCFILLPYSSLINQANMPITAVREPRTPEFSAEVSLMMVLSLFTVLTVVLLENPKQSIPHCLAFSNPTTWAPYMFFALICFELLAIVSLFYLFKVNNDLTRNWTHEEHIKNVFASPRPSLTRSEQSKREEIAEVLRRLWPMIGTSILVKIVYLVSMFIARLMDLNRYSADMGFSLLLPHLPLLIGLLTLRMLHLHFHDQKRTREILETRETERIPYNKWLHDFYHEVYAVHKGGSSKKNCCPNFADLVPNILKDPYIEEVKKEVMN